MKQPEDPETRTERRIERRTETPAEIPAETGKAGLEGGDCFFMRHTFPLTSKQLPSLPFNFPSFSSSRTSSHTVSLFLVTEKKGEVDCCFWVLCVS